MPKLIEVIANLDAISAIAKEKASPTIFARRPWTPESEAIVLRERSVNGVSTSDPQLAYLLEVDLAVEVIEVWIEWRGGVRPSLMQASLAVIWYAEHDAYEPLDDGWPYEPRRTT